MAVEYFKELGFNVSFGKKNNPYNALIYFQDKTYIEIIENMNMSKPSEILLKLFGMKDFVKGLKKMESMDEGFIRFSFHVSDEMILDIKGFCEDEFKLKTCIVNTKRNDVMGNKLKCKCLFPYNSDLPFFNTNLIGCNKLWEIKHSNNIIGIESIKYSAEGLEYDFINKFNGDNFININYGKGGLEGIEFKYDKKDDQSLVYEKGWKFRKPIPIKP